MFNDTILDQWLDKKSSEIIANMGGDAPMSSEDMMVLMLKAQTNHFNHLDVELRTDMKQLREDVTRDIKDLRTDMDKRFEQVDKRFESLIGRMDRMMIWMFATTLTVGGIVIAAGKWL